MERYKKPDPIPESEQLSRAIEGRQRNAWYERVKTMDSWYQMNVVSG